MAGLIPPFSAIRLRKNALAKRGQALQKAEAAAQRQAKILLLRKPAREEQGAPQSGKRPRREGCAEPAGL
uniref:OO_Ba0013J05-OO_Ba0033A15.26 protein n=1 Tax=Oryza officinalis TaxID=4535 RepID=D0ABG9_9ORYZ|nr:OO_Ba0013J05-OO_Ba0033A15.26 [Oryza officinalis]